MSQSKPAVVVDQREVGVGRGIGVRGCTRVVGHARVVGDPGVIVEQDRLRLPASKTSSDAKDALLRQAEVESRAGQGLLPLIATFIDGAELARAIGG